MAKSMTIRRWRWHRARGAGVRLSPPGGGVRRWVSGCAGRHRARTEHDVDRAILKMALLWKATAPPRKWGVRRGRGLLTRELSGASAFSTRFVASQVRPSVQRDPTVTRPPSTRLNLRRPVLSEALRVQLHLRLDSPRRENIRLDSVRPGRAQQCPDTASLPGEPSARSRDAPPTAISSIDARRRANDGRRPEQLPGNYVAQTTSAQRTQHFELYKRYEASTEEVLLSWAPLADGSANTELHAVFAKRLGELSTITTALNEKGIRVVRCVTFATNSGVAIDTFELTSFDQEAANHVKPPSRQGRPTAARGATKRRERCGRRVVRQLPADYVTSTTPADRLAHLELYRASDSSTHGTVERPHLVAAGERRHDASRCTPSSRMSSARSTITARCRARDQRCARLASIPRPASRLIPKLNDFDEPSADRCACACALIVAGSPKRPSPLLVTRWPRKSGPRARLRSPSASWKAQKAIRRGWANRAR